MVDCSRRQQVLKQLNSQLQSRRAGTLDLGVTGSKVPLLEPNKSANDLKPSKIPRPSTPSRPLPPPGYVSETLTAHKSTSHTVTPSSRSTGSGRRQLKVVIHGLPQSSRSEDKVNAPEIKTPPTNIDSGQRKTHNIGSRSTYAKPAVQTSAKEVTSRSRNVTRGSAVSSGPSGGKLESKKKRLAQLRTKYLVRKFGHVWIRKVFGRVHPSAARQHHAHSLVRSVFRVWCVEWWAARREWKLNIRAECHDRYRLWQLVWTAWTQYTATSREKRRLKQMADTFSSRRVTQLVWSGWCEYVGVRRRERDVRRQAEQWRSARLIRWVWLRWGGAMDGVKRRRSMETAALHHWAHRFTEQVWHHWLTRLHTRQVLQLHEEVAQRHYNQTLLFNTWARWQDYIQVRHNKRALKGLADNMYCSRLLLRTFEGWVARFERVQEIAKFQELIVERGLLAVKRRAFQHWRYYISLCWYKTQLLDLSTQFRQLSLKRRALQQLRLYSLWQQREEADRQLAHEHRTHKLLYHCWRAWLRGCEHREEMKMGPQTRIAQHHFTVVVTRKVMAAWVQYTLLRRKKRCLSKLADEQFKTYALPRCFNALRKNVEVKLYKHELRSTAEDFRRETLLSMVFYKWWREAQLSQDLRLLDRVAILHDEEVKKRRLLKFWRAQTRERVGHLAQEAAAVTRYNHWKMGVAFQKWHIRLKKRVVMERKLHQASCHCDNRLVGVVWSAWKRFIIKRRCSGERRRIADTHFTKVITHKLLLAWRGYLSLCQDKKAKVLTAERHFGSVLKRQVFNTWVKFTSESKTRKQLVSMATQHYNTVTQKKCLWVWLQRTAESIDTRQREAELVTECTHRLSRARLSRILHQWKDYITRSLAIRLATDRADTYHARVLKRRCFNGWSEYRHKRLRRTLLMRQGDWFLRNRLISACYSHWRVQFMNALVLKQKSVSALWHWSRTLQRRCLAGWLLYTLEQRRKKERYSHALDRHRKRLVTIGVTQWIKVATEMQAQREAIALQHQTKNAQAVLRRVRRCASHWLAMTRKQWPRPSHHTHATPTDTQCRVRLEPHRPHTDILADSGCGLESHAAGDWNSLLKNLQLPGGSCKDRPQPRRPHLSPPLHTTHLPQLHTTHPSPLHSAHPPQLHTTHPHTEILQPRQPLVSAPHQQTQPPQQGSFTFLTSTCSEPSQLEVTDDSRGTYTMDSPLLDHGGKGENSSEGHAVQTNESADSHMTASGQPSSVGISSDVPTTHTTSRGLSVSSPTCGSEKGRSEGVVLSHSQADSLPPTLTDPLPPTLTAPLPPTLTAPLPPTLTDPLPSTLTDPSVQQELVQMRDTFKQFHQLKARKKILVSRLSTLAEQGNAEELCKVRQELVSLSDTIISNEPLIRQCALRINQLLSQAGLTDNSTDFKN